MIIGGVDFPGFVPRFGDVRHIAAMAKAGELAAKLERLEARHAKSPHRTTAMAIKKARDEITRIMSTLK